MDLWEEDTPDPDLRYFKPTSKLADELRLVTPSFNCQLSSSYQEQYLHPYQTPRPLTAQGFSYPLSDATSLHQPQCYEGERRRVQQSLSMPMVSAESLLTALSSSPCDPQQEYNNCQVSTDSLIHDEVTRAAKTLFSKRNRTLLHWLNPNVSKSQLKIDVNAAWESLPEVEKLFYISQVLGKFAPHTTSLMVNPQLEPSKCLPVKIEKEDRSENKSNESGSQQDILQMRDKQFRARTIKREKKTQKTKVDYRYSSSDETSCDSGLVFDYEASRQPVKLVTKAKRKYTRRKLKGQTSTNSITVGTTELQSEISCPIPVDDTKVKIETGSNIVTTKAKRKYVKRKLVRKKYTKRDPNKWKELIKPEIEVPFRSTKNISELQHITDPTSEDNTEEIDVWIDLEKGMGLSGEEDCYKLLNEEVDSFWESIGDANNLFMELDLESNVI